MVKPTKVQIRVQGSDEIVLYPSIAAAALELGIKSAYARRKLTEKPEGFRCKNREVRRYNDEPWDLREYSEYAYRVTLILANGKKVVYPSAREAAFAVGVSRNTLISYARKGWTFGNGILPIVPQTKKIRSPNKRNIEITDTLTGEVIVLKSYSDMMRFFSITRPTAILALSRRKDGGLYRKRYLLRDLDNVKSKMVPTPTHI